jgi:hypothetical protein
MNAQDKKSGYFYYNENPNDFRETFVAWKSKHPTATIVDAYSEAAGEGRKKYIFKYTEI